MSLIDSLEEYNNSDAYPFHMPGHKRCEGKEFPAFIQDWFRYDITEIDDFDNLHHANGIIKTAMDKTAKLYHSKQSYFLVNGSTCGILAAISAAVPRGGRILMSRGSHKSAYNAVMLRDLDAVYLYSKQCDKLGLDVELSLDAIKKVICESADQDDLEQTLKEDGNSIGGNTTDACKYRKKIDAVFLTSPTYEGISLNIREIAEYLHSKNIPLIVDAAHGAHFGMAGYLPENAVDAGADIVIHSLHKTLPSPTQTAVLHFNSDLISIAKLKRFLGVYETSSPSYPMMAAMECCVDYLLADRKKEWDKFYHLREILSEKLSDLKVIGVLDYFSVHNEFGLTRSQLPEIGKMVIYLRRNNELYDAKWLYDRLRIKYHLQPEFALPQYLLLFMTLMDTEESYERLNKALHEIDEELYHLMSSETKPAMRETPENKRTERADNEQINNEQINNEQINNEQINSEQNINLPSLNHTNIRKLRISEAEECEKLNCQLENAEGKVCGDFVYVYPPGQPLIVPGEVISKHVMDQILGFQEAGFEVHGVSGQEINIIEMIYLN